VSGTPDVRGAIVLHPEGGAKVPGGLGR
jgi:hypothetical protein